MSRAAATPARPKARPAQAASPSSRPAGGLLGQVRAPAACLAQSRCSVTAATAAPCWQFASPLERGERLNVPVRARVLLEKSKPPSVAIAEPQRASAMTAALGIPQEVASAKGSAAPGPRNKAIAETAEQKRAFAATTAPGTSMARAPTKAPAPLETRKPATATSALRRPAATAATGPPASSSQARSANTSRGPIGSIANPVIGISARRTVSGSPVNRCSRVESGRV